MARIRFYDFAILIRAALGRQSSALNYNFLPLIFNLTFHEEAR
jgi:hypothetical protein